MDARDRLRFRKRAKELARLMASKTRMLKIFVTRSPVKTNDKGVPYLQVAVQHIGHEENIGCISYYYPTVFEINDWWDMGKEDREDYAIRQGLKLRWRNEVAREDRQQIVQSLEAML